MLNVMSLVPRLGRRLYTNLINLGTFLHFVVNKRNTGNPAFERSVFLELSEPKLERYYYLLAKCFELSGWQVLIKLNANLLLNLRNCSDRIYDLAGVRFVASRPESPDLHLTFEKSDWRERKIQVDVNYFSAAKDERGFIWPYPMHADVYDELVPKRLSALRFNPRTIRIFFGGNTGPSYDNPEMDTLFGKVNRKRLADIIESVLNGVEFISVDSKSGFAAAKQNGRRSLVWLKKEVRLDIGEWMDALAAADCFIAAPGNSMPFSHNAIEAMAVGTIPILEYAEMFSPGLEHGVNCITYDGETDFLEKIEWCRHLSDEEIAALRNGVTEYYDMFLKPQSIVQRLLEQAGSISKLYLNAEHVSVMNLRESLTQNDL